LSSNTNKTENWFLTEVGSEIVKKKYLHDGEQDAYDLATRVASIFSTGELQEQIDDAILDADFFPAGRTLYGAGAKGKFKASLSNCYILPSPEDNIESIFEVAKKAARIFSMGGGCGVNLSKLRPNGARVSNAAKTSTGAVSFMEIFNAAGTVIGANNRRAALLIGLNCDHPDIEEFLEVKKNNDKIQSANISILFTNEFMACVKNNDTYQLKFKVESTGQFVEKIINARDFFMKFCEVNHQWGEPGCLFIDRVRDYNIMSNDADYLIEICNPCFTGDMQLLTDTGYRSFENLEGQKFNVIGLGGVISESKVWCSGNKEIVEVEVGNKSSKHIIRCTPDHVFMLADGSECQAKDLAGKVLPITNISIPHNKHFAKLGFIQGDGQLSDLNNPGKNGITINFGKKDGDVLELFQITEDKLEANGRTYYTGKFTNDIVNLGFETETLLNRGFPSTFGSWSSIEKLSFLRGMYSANGSILGGKGAGRITYKTINPTLASQLHMLLCQFGFQSYITTNKPTNVKFSNGVYQCRESYDVNIGRYMDKVKFANLIGFEQKYKMEKLESYLSSHLPKVKRVVFTGEKEFVYDFVEPVKHWGIVEGLVVHNCAEYTGSEYNSCNLGSINLYNCVTNPFTPEADIDYLKLQSLTSMAVEALDEILDYGYDTQPLGENKTNIDKYRPIGLGVFGLADMFIAIGVRYGSEQSNTVTAAVMHTIRESAIKKSCQLGFTKGGFEGYDQALWHGDYLQACETNGKKKTLRNGSLLSIAPTGTIATMCGISGGIEPLFKISYQRTTHSLQKQGKYFSVFAKSVEHLLIHNNLDPLKMTVEEIKKRFPYVVDTYDILPSERIAVQSTMQEYVDNAISSTINLKESATVEDVFNTYMQAWESGCKGLTVFRQGCMRNAIIDTVECKTPSVCMENVLDSIKPLKRGKQRKMDGSTFVGATACVPKLYTTVNQKDGQIFELFTNVSSGCKSNINVINRLASLAIRSGVEVNEVIGELKSNVCPACSTLKLQGKNISMSCGSCIGEALEEAYLGLQGVKQTVEVELLPCPECHEATLRPDGKCYTCHNCGYSKCD